MQVTSAGVSPMVKTLYHIVIMQSLALMIIIIPVALVTMPVRIMVANGITMPMPMQNLLEIHTALAVL